MALPIPSYIPIGEISVPLVNYEWDSWDPYALVGKTDDRTLDALAGVSDRGIIVFTIGCSEWVIYRLLPHVPSRHATSALLYLEAWWALAMDAPIAIPPDPIEGEWQGKERAPIALALITISNAWRLAENGESDAHGGFAERLPLLVLKDPSPFVAWKAEVLKRLKYFHPYHHNECTDTLVAREVLDPTVDLNGVNQNDLARRTLNSISLNDNPYIEAIKRYKTAVDPSS